MTYRNNNALPIVKAGYNEATRNLDFRAECGDFQELIECAKVIGGYNKFNVDIVEKLGEITKGDEYRLTYHIGREGSVVIYITAWGDLSPLKMDLERAEDKLLFDEIDLFKNNSELRLWWD